MTRKKHNVRKIVSLAETATEISLINSRGIRPKKLRPDPSQMPIESVETGIILAAGLSQRFGVENKLLAEWRGRSLAAHAIEAAANSALRHIILVTGRDGDEIATLATSPKIERAHNSRFEDGLSSSLQTGLAAAPEGPVMVMLADMPMVSSALIDELIDAWRADAYALIPEHNGQTGNPVILSTAARADANALTGDRGARRLFDGRSDVIHHSVADAAVLWDLDSKADFSR
jgi:molybdenum cofactor cytidylyltransferase